MEKQKKVKIAFWMNLAIFVLECIGGYLYFIRSGWDFVQFYTEDSNTLALITCLFLAVYEYQMWKGQRSVLPGWIQELKYIATVCLTLTFLVVVFILIPLQGGIGSAYFFLINGSMLYHHLICPILAFVSFLWFDPMEKRSRREIGMALLPTLVYALVLVILNLAKLVDGPYPFLKVYQQPVYMSCIWVAVILGAAYAIAAILSKMSNQHTK